MRAPEHVERAIEHRELIVTMHEERAAGVIDLVARAEIDVLQRVRHVDQTADMHVDAEPRSSRPKTTRLCWRLDKLPLPVSSLFELAPRPIDR